MCAGGDNVHAVAAVVGEGRAKVVSKKLQKESVVCPRTALFLTNLDGRQITETTQDTSTETR